MLYKPNYCCNCGEKIARAEWNLLTSRRFCEACAAEQKKHDILPRAAVAAGVLAVMFGIGTFFGGSGSAVGPAQTKSSATVGLHSAEPQRVEQTPKTADQAVAPPQNLQRSETGTSTLQADDRQTGGNETAVSAFNYCGALTKKGTPCSRKVKKAGTRCFQHEGKPAMQD